MNDGHIIYWILYGEQQQQQNQLRIKNDNKK